MIYCPHCNKPSARNTGPCPHCKGELSDRSGTASAPHPTDAADARKSTPQSAPRPSTARPTAQSAELGQAKKGQNVTKPTGRASATGPESPTAQAGGQPPGEMVIEHTSRVSGTGQASLKAQTTDQRSSGMTIERTSRVLANATAPSTAEAEPVAADQMIIEHTRVDKSPTDVQAGSLVSQHGMADWEAASEEMAQPSSSAKISSGTGKPKAPGVELAAFDGQSHVGDSAPTSSTTKKSTLASEEEPPVLALDSYAPDISGLLDDETGGVDVTLSAQEIDQVAGYGLARGGPIGALMYWRTVTRRKKVLLEQEAQAAAHSSAQEKKKRDSLAALGREVAKLKVEDKALKDLVGQASLAQGELRGKQRQHSHLSNEHEEKLKPLEARLAILDKEAEPIREHEAQINKEHEALMVKCRHVETKKKRFQIDLRNMDELIGKRQELFHNPEIQEAEKDKAFKEINQFEARRPKLIEEISACDKQLDELSVPVTGIEAQLTDVRSKLQAKAAVIQGVADQIKQLSDEFAKLEGAAAEEVQAESEKVEDAWAAVGKKVLADNMEFNELAGSRKQVITAITSAQDAKRKHALIAAAIDSYHKPTIEQAKKTAIVVLILIVALIAAAIFLG